jgi:hypothetical protein
MEERKPLLGALTRLIKLGVCINEIYISLNYARHATMVLKLGVLETNDWKMLGIGRLECVSYGVVWRVLLC